MKARERVILFGRVPRPGEAKTRLIPAIGTEGAARLYRAFLDDAVAMASSARELELWVPDTPGAVERLSRRYPDLAIRLQPDGDLGGRLRAAFDAAFAEGVDYAVILGSDHPTLPPEYVERAFRAQRGAHLVLGPTEDGGYYAIGLRRYCWPGAAGLFDGAPWSTSDLLEWTRRRAQDLALCHVELPVWYDVDEPADLERLRADVRVGSATGRALTALNLERPEIGDA
ncbi:MAG: TIGR04282 family arsenosugar biosynthesis glycosyltransferase [Gemmatimonadota bacterium]|nr:TIGR04282 family arsenosugar biosynthesis glycosyltransferase [Gemmatimonadota bacterium]